MNILKAAPSLLCAILISSPLFAQDSPVIVIDQNVLLNVHVKEFTGSKGVQAKPVLERDLTMSGVARIVAEAEADYIASGSAEESSVSGTFIKKGGSSIVDETFSADWRTATHMLADRIVEAATGQKGIATSKVAFISAHNGHKELYLMDIDGANVRQLTNDKSTALGPRFSPDGKKIAFTSFRKNFPDVWAIDLSAKVMNRISFYPGLNAQAAYSPDGQKIALTLSKDGNTELYTISATGGSPTRLTRTRGTEASPTWSPAGDRLAFVSDDRGTAQLYVIPSAGGVPDRLNTRSTYATEPDWSPDGKKLAYSVRLAGQFQIAVMDMATYEQSQITSSGNNESPSWTRNSRHILFARDGEIQLLDSLTRKSMPIRNGLTRNSEPNASR